MFELIIIIQRREQGEPLWGRTNCDFTCWASMCTLTNAIDKARPPTDQAICKVRGRDPIMTWWVVADSHNAWQYLVSATVDWPKRLSNRYWTTDLDSARSGVAHSEIRRTRLSAVGKGESRYENVCHHLPWCCLATLLRGGLCQDGDPSKVYIRYLDWRRRVAPRD